MKRSFIKKALAALTVLVSIAAIYQQSRDFVLSVYLYLALGLYFQSYNTVRYYLVLGMLLYAMRPLIQKQYIRFVLIALVVFLLIKGINAMRRKKEEEPEPEAPAGPTAEELLADIKGILEKQAEK